MTAREYLYQAKNLDDYINAKTKELSQFRSKIRTLSAVKYDGINVKSSNRHDFTDDVDSLVKLEDNINKDINRLVDLKTEISRMIDKLNDNRYKAVLTRYYLNNEKFDDIARDMKYSFRQTLRLHGYALEEFRKIYAETVHHVI